MYEQGNRKLRAVAKHNKGNPLLNLSAASSPLLSGDLGMHFWTTIAFAYLFTVLESMRCALAGMYADVPFVCDAAYIQIPYD
ncbi:hypothetical protein RJ639_031763 [Escallonia herrerae]|uniref:Protein TIC 20 n=1 Tax=Escallonia herrerae TaxID=1293975 RepID=A0AA88WYF5_9ASTE|nr:hypothetical protein RJ639_031763 [Escallonia herrerae]